MKIYDKAAWHIDGGEDEKQVVLRMKLIFEQLSECGFLSSDGEEILEIGIDESVSLNEKMLTDDGAKFLDEYYDSVILKSDFENLIKNIDIAVKAFEEKQCRK